MADTVEPLILDLLEWLAKLPVWEDANDRGLIQQEEVDGRSVVRVTPAGRALVGRRR
jgi:hypothetical protein